MNKALFFMMVGLPGCGKSTLSGSIGLDRVSSDDFIEAKAKRFSTTYSAVFAETIDEATKYANMMVERLIYDKIGFVLDRTNLSAKSRKKSLARISKRTYKRVAVLVTCSDETEWRKRLDGRPGKVINDKIIMDMKASYEEPSLDEGFDLIMRVDTADAGSVNSFFQELEMIKNG